MFSPRDSPAVKDWFRRLDVAWRRLPAEERDSQREEVQQHLEGIVTAGTTLGQSPEAAWEAALARFGDPTQIGRKISQEWQQSRTGFRADMKAILFGCGLESVRGAVIQCLYFSSSQPGGPPHAAPFLLWMLNLPVTALISFGIGRKYPHQAMKSALFWPFLQPVTTWAMIAVAVLSSTSRSWTHLPVGNSLPKMFLNLIMFAGPTFFMSCIVAYLASVTKRGWYRPSLADFKLTLLRKRPQTSR